MKTDLFQSCGHCLVVHILAAAAWNKGTVLLTVLYTEMYSKGHKSTIALEDAYTWQCKPDVRTNLREVTHVVLDVWMHILIFESSQLEDWYVWDQQYIQISSGQIVSYMS